MRNFFWLLVSLLLFFLTIVLWQMHNHHATVDYVLLRKDHQFEIRQYPSLLVAQTEIIGNQYLAMSNGFAILNDYLQANNQQRKKLPMLLPVTQQKQANVWIVTFYLPNWLSILSAPAPTNPHVHIRQLKAQKYIVHRFSGLATAEHMQTHLNLFRGYLKLNHIQTQGEPIYAYYNPPWTLPFLRHNEILIGLGV